MTDRAITSNMRRGRGPTLHVFEHYNLAAITAATLHEWIAPFDGRIVDVICDSETAGSGGTSDIIDVNINGTSIYTTQANRPTLLTGDTGLFTEAGEPEITTFRAGDVIQLEADQIAATGSARFKAAIVVVQR